MRLIQKGARMNIEVSKQYEVLCIQAQTTAEH